MPWLHMIRQWGTLVTGDLSCGKWKRGPVDRDRYLPYNLAPRYGQLGNSCKR